MGRPERVPELFDHGSCRVAAATGMRAGARVVRERAMTDCGNMGTVSLEHVMDLFHKGFGLGHQVFMGLEEL